MSIGFCNRRKWMQQTVNIHGLWHVTKISHFKVVGGICVGIICIISMLEPLMV